MPMDEKENVDMKQSNLNSVKCKINVIRDHLSNYITRLSDILKTPSDNDDDKYKAIFVDINALREEFGKAPLPLVNCNDAVAIEQFLKTAFKDPITNALDASLNGINYINTGIDSQDQITNTPHRNLSYWLAAFNSTWFSDNFYPGSPAMLVTVGISAVSFVYYVLDQQQKESQRELNATSFYVLSQLCKHNEEINEAEQQALVRQFNIINTKYLLQHFDNMLAAIDKDLSTEINHTPKKNTLFNRILNSRVMKVIYPIWGAIGMYSMVYWVLAMSIGYGFGVGLGGAMMVIGTAAMFGLPAIIPLLFLALYGGVKLHRYIQQRNIEKTLESTLQKPEIDIIKQKLALKEDLSSLEQAHFQTYIEMQTFASKRKLALLAKAHPELEVKDLVSTVLKTTPHLPEEPKAIKHLRVARFKRVFFGTLFGFLSGYMVAQFAFGPIFDAMDLVQTSNQASPVLGTIGNVFYVAVLAMSLIFAVTYAVVRGIYAATASQEDEDKIESLNTEVSEEKNTFFKQFQAKVNHAAEETLQVSDERNEGRKNKQTALNIISDLYAQLLLKRKNCLTLSNEVNQLLLATNRLTPEKQLSAAVYNPSIDFPGADNDEFHRSFTIKPTKWQQFKNVLSVLLPGVDGWGTGMYIVRSIIPLLTIIGIAVSVVSGGIALPVCLGIGLGLGITIGSLKAYRSYMEKEVARDRDFLSNIETRTTSIHSELEVRTKQEKYLTASKVYLTGGQNPGAGGGAAINHSSSLLLPAQEEDNSSVPSYGTLQSA